MCMVCYEITWLAETIANKTAFNWRLYGPFKHESPGPETSVGCKEPNVSKMRNQQLILCLKSSPRHCTFHQFMYITLKRLWIYWWKLQCFRPMLKQTLKFGFLTIWFSALWRFIWRQADKGVWSFCRNHRVRTSSLPPSDSSRHRVHLGSVLSSRSEILNKY